MTYTTQNGPPPDTGTRPEESALTRTKQSVPPPVTIWGVSTCDLGAHADSYGWITNVPVSALPCPPAGSLVRIDTGDAIGIDPTVLFHIAELTTDGCRIEVCGSRPQFVEHVVTGLRAMFARKHSPSAPEDMP